MKRCNFKDFNVVIIPFFFSFYKNHVRHTLQFFGVEGIFNLPNKSQI